MFSTIISLFRRNANGVESKEYSEDESNKFKEPEYSRNIRDKTLRAYGIDPDYEYHLGTESRVIGIKGMNISTLPVECRYMQYLFSKGRPWHTTGNITVLANGDFYCNDIIGDLTWLSVLGLDQIIEEKLYMIAVNAGVRCESGDDQWLQEIISEAVQLQNSICIGKLPNDFIQIMNTQLSSIEELADATRYNSTLKFIKLQIDKCEDTIVLDVNDNAYIQRTRTIRPYIQLDILEIYFKLKVSVEEERVAEVNIIMECDKVILGNPGYDFIMRLDRKGTAMKVLFNYTSKIYRYMNKRDVMVLKDGRVLFKNDLSKSTYTKYLDAFIRMEQGDKK